MKDDCKELFGKRLRQLRKSRHWSQEELAHEAGLDRSYLGAVERGEVNISLMNICALAHTLSVEPCELLRFAKNSQPPENQEEQG
ncbi:MAG: helix-turn-helix domain-containing protein [Blastocatellia bacterium]|nr:helix-turn-helix domain-containing protein [Blastocatellia bacterium]